MMQRFKNWRLRRTPFHSTYPSRSDFVMNHVDRRMAVDRERGFIYFRIPKAANSTICYRLARQKNPDIDNADDAKRSFLRGSDLTWDEVKHLKDRFYLFTFVRNPYSRIASAYLDKVERMKPKQQQVLSNLQKGDGTPLTFLEFCRYLDRGGLYDDPHWFPQVDLIPADVDMLDFVGRVESLETDLSKVASTIGQSDGAGNDTSVWSPHETGADLKVRELYCGETLSIVRKIYSDDFRFFVYDSVPHWEEFAS
ncbi:sulfotransferase family protein [Aquisalimonas asiatica]|uniref:Sulfotransferase family protein n=1 Tax=Aquisalimonas asiatica TaxID=406100 RepID=A0A1H8VH95_9GAMM|nr:sulfotransferase family protein [Aquisalimonas asiatica]SEP14781.1 Sulfotransferase family protein [Aquisalimonas asiatica]